MKKVGAFSFGIMEPLFAMTPQETQHSTGRFAMTLQDIRDSLSMTTPVSIRRHLIPNPNLLISFLTLGSSAGLTFTYRLRLRLPDPTNNVSGEFLCR